MFSFQVLSRTELIYSEEGGDHLESRIKPGKTLPRFNPVRKAANQIINNSNP